MIPRATTTTTTTSATKSIFIISLYSFIISFFLSLQYLYRYDVIKKIVVSS